MDLPGYGYTSFADATTKEQWGKMIENYLGGSERLKTVFLLLDIRHEPSENDAMMYDWILQAGFTPIIIATKADKIKRSQLAKQVKILRDGLEAKSRVRISGTDDMRVIPWSGLSKAGRDDILRVIEGHM